ncbi:LacI family DNA-binding transcriptional regulator [Piscinibacter gummiphilus]|uniref:LacI family DNA-binding transcriptional regulator n=1 Tax=Piscinibacter gummiphilus TaxID=946333 RepID=A0ABZ0CZM1_9BURK|nr:LacI family DNA-binding transcriptional regulator [Piscinibacter gummiphilus]WOB10447.1 LacI family DNA-binding transcriptional regulator [Piscinibacter gummiphilus]
MSSSRRPRATGRVTLGDVAAAAGVSPITVSRALRGERSVAAELVARVQSAAQQLGYVPDPAARALASARSSHVAVLIPLLTNTLFVDLLEAVHRTLLPAGFQTLIGVTHYDPQEEEQLLRSYMAHRPAGLLVTGFDRTEASRQLIAASGVPCVHVMETTQAPGVHSVGFSQTDAGHAITAHLLARGRKRIAFVAAQLDPRVMQRAEGYRRCLREAGLYDPKLELLNPERSSMALGGQLFEEVLKTRPDVDAMFFCNDDLAQGGLLAALRMGVKVPERVAVAGFNDLAGSDQMLPPLTTVHTPRTEIGEEAARMLLALMRREPVAQASIDVGYQLMQRQST